jgi:hypothetical protein
VRILPPCTFPAWRSSPQKSLLASLYKTVWSEKSPTADRNFGAACAVGNRVDEVWGGQSGHVIPYRVQYNIL